MARSQDLRATLSRFALAVAGVVVLGLVAGWLYGRTNPERAASTLVADLVVSEPVGSEQLDPAAPTSGDPQGETMCGVRDEQVGLGSQVASLDAGVVIVQYRARDLTVEEIGTLREVADDESGVLIAPNPDLGAAVVATAWTRRLGLEGPNRELVSAFVTAYSDPEACSRE